MEKWVQDMDGTLHRIHDTTGMFSPVECLRCGSVYDVGTVTVTARYSDCSMWITPCCHQQVDDRQAGWVSRPAIRYITRSEQ